MIYKMWYCWMWLNANIVEYYKLICAFNIITQSHGVWLLNITQHQVAPWGGRIPRRTGIPDLTPPVRQQQSQRSWSRRATFLSETSGNRGLTVFTTYLSWTLTPWRTYQRCRRNAPTRRKIVRIRCIWRLASSNVGTSLLCRLGERAAGGKGDSYPEKDSH